MRPRRSEAGWVTLIELLVVTALIVVVIYLVYGTRAPGGVGEVGGAGDSTPGEARTRPGAALERARGVQCQQNLVGLRQLISAYRIDSEQNPASLEELRGAPRACPVSGNPYVYDPLSGAVHCTTPGHENF